MTGKKGCRICRTSSGSLETFAASMLRVSPGRDKQGDGYMSSSIRYSSCGSTLRYLFMHLTELLLQRLRSLLAALGGGGTKPGLKVQVNTINWPIFSTLRFFCQLNSGNWCCNKESLKVYMAFDIYILHDYRHQASSPGESLLALNASSQDDFRQLHLNSLWSLLSRICMFSGSNLLFLKEKRDAALVQQEEGI